MKTASGTTSVHTEETTGQISTHQSYQDYRRSSCAAEFYAAANMYLDLDERDELNRSSQLDKCRKQAWFVRNVSTGHVHVASNACRLRWCPICNRSKSTYITHSVKPWIESLKTARFLTLTLKHSNAPLAAQITKLYADFRKLRKDTQFKKLCSGGVWFFQIKLSGESQQWHPHIHCILSGKYIGHEWLSRKWLYITKSSKIVDIRMVRDPEKAATEVARYSASPSQLSKLNGSERLEVFDAMHRRRMCGTWGKAKGVSLSAPKSVDKAKYEDLGNYCIVLGLAESDPAAKKIYLAWINETPLEAGVEITSIDKWLDGLPANIQAMVDKDRPDPFLDYG